MHKIVIILDTKFTNISESFNRHH